MYSSFKRTFLVTSMALFASASFTSAQAQNVEAPAVQNGRFQVQSYPDASQTLKFHVYLPLRNIAQLDSLIADRSSPSSPRYHQFLTPAQFREQFGPPPEYFNRATNALQKLGFQVTGRTSQSIEAQGSVATINQAFRTRLARVRYRNGHTALKSLTHLTLPAALAQLDAQVAEFSPTIGYHVNSIRTTSSIPDNRKSPTGSYWFDDLKQAYEFPSYQTVNGAGRTIGIVIDSDVNDDDINAYFAHEQLQAPKIVRRLVNGGAPFDPNGGDSSEAELDVEQAGGMAPGATLVVYNIPDLSDEGVIAGYTAIVEDNKVDIVNSSFGECEQFYTAPYNNGVDNSGLVRTTNNIFRQGNAQGITFVAASGDFGGLACTDLANATTPPTNPPSVVGKFIAGVSFPASSPYVTAVGGTNLVTTSNPPSLESKYIRENAYSDPLEPFDPFGTGNLASGGVWGSGGGESIFFSKPLFQQLVNTGTKKRAVPDVSLHMGGCPGGISKTPCGPDRSADILYFNGKLEGAIGTSASSPDFAGLLALKQQALGGARLGNENYDIYALAALNGKSRFKFYRQDIPGDNGVFTTKPGYNMVLGNGTIFGKNFVLLPLAPSAGDPQTPSNP